MCHACRGLWFDHGESLRLAPQGVVELFRELHMHKDDAQTPLARPLDCPRCRRTLDEGVDVVRSGRYVTWRCASRHGRFATFASFMIDRGAGQLNTYRVTTTARPGTDLLALIAVRG